MHQWSDLYNDRLVHIPTVKLVHQQSDVCINSQTCISTVRLVCWRASVSTVRLIDLYTNSQTCTTTAWLVYWQTSTHTNGQTCTSIVRFVHQQTCILTVSYTQLQLDLFTNSQTGTSTVRLAHDQSDLYIDRQTCTSTVRLCVLTDLYINSQIRILIVQTLTSSQTHADRLVHTPAVRPVHQFNQTGTPLQSGSFRYCLRTTLSCLEDRQAAFIWRSKQ